MSHIIVGAAQWAPYLLNGDVTSLSEGERDLADAWLDRELHDGENIVSCGEPFFTWQYWLYTGVQAEGGDVCEYTVDVGERNVGQRTCLSHAF